HDVFVLEYTHGVIHLPQCAHPGREQDGPPTHCVEQLVVGEHRARNLVARHVEAVEALHRLHVECRGEPDQSCLRCTVAEGLEVRVRELQPPAILDVGHHTPRGLARHVPPVGSHVEVRVADLELHCVRTGHCRGVDQLTGSRKRSVVVDADLGHHKHPVTDHVRADADHRKSSTFTARSSTYTSAATFSPTRSSWYGTPHDSSCERVSP